MEKAGFEIFLENLQTREDLLNLLDEIRTATELIFKTGDYTKEKSLSKDFLSNLVKAEELGAFPASASNRVKFLEDLAVFAREQKSVKIVLAFEPSQQFLKRIGDFISPKQKLFLDLSVDPEIIGGFILEEGGRYTDYSLVSELTKASSDKDFLKQILSKES